MKMETTIEPTLYFEGIDKILEIFFFDISRLPIEENELFLDLFYDRIGEFRNFQKKLECSKENKENFLIKGRSGIGKTSFIKRFIIDIDLQKRLNICPLFVDYRTAIPKDWIQCILNFIKDTQTTIENRYLDPVHGLKENSESNIRYNINIIYDHLKYLASKKNAPHFVLFLDDFDYAEDTWFKLLDYFMPFAELISPVSVVLSIRPPLLAEIEAYDNRYTFHFTRNTNIFDLESLSVREVLISRLAPMLVKKEKENSITSLINFFKTKTSLEKKIDTISKSLGLTSFKELRTFEYPLTEIHNIFMEEITNGDYREIFDMALESICYVLKHYDDLKTREEYGYIRKVIGHERILQIFFDNHNSRHKIIDINKKRSGSNNSLYYNTLEAIKIYQEVDEKLFSSLKKLGHSEKKVIQAIKFLQAKENRLIEPLRIFSSWRKERRGESEEYRCTKKGYFYLKMASWPEYIHRCDHFGKSLIEEELG